MTQMKPDYTFCTIVTRSYLRGAAALAEGLARHHPEASLHTLILDPGDDPIPLAEGMVRHDLDELAIPAMPEMKLYYDAHSLSNNLKPFFMRFVARGGHRRVLFLDSDIMVTGRLSAALDALEEHSFVLTPHLVVAEKSHLGVVALDVMADYGAYNGGFIGVRTDEAGLAVLDWLCGRLEKTALRFADQKILTLCTQLFARHFRSLEDPACNVAYWNVHERDLHRQEDRFLVGAEPLAFFHFSGYRFDEPAAFVTRFRRLVNANATLQALSDEYGRIIARHAHLRFDGYGFDRFDGRRLTAGLREHYFRKGSFDGYQRDRVLRHLRRLTGLRLLRS